MADEGEASLGGKEGELQVEFLAGDVLVGIDVEG